MKIEISPPMAQEVINKQVNAIHDLVLSLMVQQDMNKRYKIFSDLAPLVSNAHYNIEEYLNATEK
jgi:hypothetical protein